MNARPRELIFLIAAKNLGVKKNLVSGVSAYSDVSRLDWVLLSHRNFPPPVFRHMPRYVLS